MNGSKTKLIILEEEKNSVTVMHHKRAIYSPYYYNSKKIQYNSNYNINKDLKQLNHSLSFTSH